MHRPYLHRTGRLIYLVDDDPSLSIAIVNLKGTLCFSVDFGNGYATVLQKIVFYYWSSVDSLSVESCTCVIAAVKT